MKAEFFQIALHIYSISVISERLSASDTKNIPANIDPLPAEIPSYLTQFGYLPPADPLSGNLRSEKAVRNAIKRLQRFAGLNATGTVDSATQKLLKTKRCGLPDFQYEEDPLENSVELSGINDEESGHGSIEENWLSLSRLKKRRKKRFVLQGSKWDHDRISYRIKNWTPHLGPGRVRREIYHALKLWSDVSALKFVETKDDKADIQIEFASREHGDGYPFDGPNIVLAHAFFPGSGNGGDAHFDGDEKWTDRKDITPYDHDVSLYSVAAHEFGHSLGMSHSSVKGSLMYPYYQQIDPFLTLPYDDTIGIQKLYGRGGRPPPTKPPIIPTTSTTTTTTPPTSTLPAVPTTAGPPSPCDGHLDAVSRIRNEIFVFKGRYFWRFDEQGYLVEEPFPIDLFWTGFPKNLTKIDAFFEIKQKDEIVFFSGRKYWIFTANHARGDYPRDISRMGLDSSVEKIDGAFVWGFNKKTYLFSGDRYWRFDVASWKVEVDYPRNIAIWKGISANIDAVFTDPSEKTYFFAGDQVLQFNGYFMRVEKRFPISVKEFWTHCSGHAEIWFVKSAGNSKLICFSCVLYFCMFYFVLRV